MVACLGTRLAMGILIDTTMREDVSRLPSICGAEDRVARAMAGAGPVFLPHSGIAFDRIRSAFTIALHMHQPLIPAGGSDLKTARIVSNLQHMLESKDSRDNYNARTYRWCYQRMGQFIPQLVDEGKRPRVMLDYSGCLLHGLQLMGADEVLEALTGITRDPACRDCVEWLGAPWGHAVAPSTPPQDYRLHVRAWQNHFASLFGFEALARVRGFSPAEMALPNHPDVAYEFVKTLRDCGYRWVLVQEHTVETVGDGARIRSPHLPQRLIAKNSRGEVASIIAIIKTQGSDAKLVAQMQPYYEAAGLSRVELAGKSVPPLVTQISDGENGGVMMNEFPPKYTEVMAEASDSPTPAVNVTEYLEYLERIGLGEEDFVPIQPMLQKRIWDRFEDGAGPEAMNQVIRELSAQDHRFSVEGGSWTNNLSWVCGYEDVLDCMQSASAMFAERVLRRGVPPSDPRYRRALYHLLASQSSCYRYWGPGAWTAYGREMCRRTQEILKQDFPASAG